MIKAEEAATVFAEMQRRAEMGCEGRFVDHACSDPEFAIPVWDWCAHCLMGAAVQVRDEALARTAQKLSSEEAAAALRRADALSRGGTIEKE